MSDPFAVFDQESESRRETLKMLWPDLYASLARPKAGRPAWGCAFAEHVNGERRTYAPVVGRLWLNGPPGCRECIDRKSKRPGGYPLELVADPVKWRDDHE